MPSAKLILTPSARATIFGPPAEREEALRRYVLPPEDAALARRHRRAHNRLGFAVQLVLVRPLRPDEVLPVALVEVVAEQLGVEPAVFDLYARRDETRREHIGEITALLGLRAMRKADYRPSIMAAAQTAVATERAEPIVRAIVEDLKLRRVIVPKLKNLIGVIARLQVLRQIGLADDRRKSIHANRYNVIAREARVMPARDLLRFTPERRCAVLVAFAVERQAALTDLAR